MPRGGATAVSVEIDGPAATLHLDGTLDSLIRPSDLEADLRYNRVDMEAGEVGGYLGMMSPQQERLDELAAAFNAADRSISDSHSSSSI